MGLLPLPSSCLHHSLYLLWVMQRTENRDLWVCQESKGGLHQACCFQESVLGMMSKKDWERLAAQRWLWVSLGSPSGNSWPLLQENQMAKGDSLDSMCWNCTDVVVRRIRKGKRKRQSTVILTILKLSWFFFYFHEVAMLPEPLFTAVAVPYPE